MIQGFANKAAEDLFNGVNSARARRLGPAHVREAAVDMLDLMNVASTLEDLRSPPSNHLEKLRGKWAGYYSVRISKQFRIVFRWTDSGPAEVRFDDHTY